MSVMSLCGCFYGKEAEHVRGILMSIGKVLTLPESMMNAVTALSGSGPAFIALFVEALIASGEKMGISRPDSTLLAVQTVLGTARLLDTGISPENLRKMVTSPGGTTEAGLKVFGEKDLTGLIAAALEAARKRAEELGRRA
jgi:pyrroline-5-carboxylate reductase